MSKNSTTKKVATKEKVATKTTKKSATNVTKKTSSNGEPIPITPTELEIVKESITYKGLLGYGLIQFGEAIVKSDAKGNASGSLVWKNNRPTKVYVTPNDLVYDLKEIELETEFTIEHMKGGVYKVLSKKGEPNPYSGGSWRVRFFKPVNNPIPVVDYISVNVAEKIDEKKKDKNPTKKSVPKKSVPDNAAIKNAVTNTKGDSSATENPSCKMTEILVKFAEKIDKDFNLMSVCDVSARKYAEDYVHKELKGITFDVEKACAEFGDFLDTEVKDNVVDDAKEKAKEKEKKKVRGTKSATLPVKKDILEKVVKKVIEKKVVDKKVIEKNIKEVKKIESTKNVKNVKEGKGNKKVTNTNEAATTVISLKGKNDEWGSKLEKCPDDVVYIGRKINRGGWNLESSEFCNPYVESKSGPRNEVISKYREYITTKLTDEPSLKDKLLTYKGKRLACWCAPEACHGDVLCELITKIENGEFEKVKEIETVKSEEEKEVPKGKAPAKGKGEGRKGRVSQTARVKPNSSRSKKALPPTKRASKKINKPQISEEEFKQWFENGSGEYKVADIREILKGLEIPGITSNITKKAMKDVASKYVVERDDSQ